MTQNLCQNFVSKVVSIVTTKIHAWIQNQVYYQIMTHKLLLRGESSGFNPFTLYFGGHSGYEAC